MKTKLNSNQLNVAIIDWLRENKTAIQGLGIGKAAEAFRSATGHEVGVGRMKSQVDACGLSGWVIRPSRPKNINDGHTRDAVLAKAIRHLYDALGEDCPFRDDLSLIVARTTPQVEQGELAG